MRGLHRRFPLPVGRGLWLLDRMVPFAALELLDCSRTVAPNPSDVGLRRPLPFQHGILR